MTATIGRIKEFAPEVEPITAYLKRFQMLISANAIEDSKVVPTLLTVVGSKPYSLLRGLVSSEFPKDKTYDELVDLLKKHLTLNPLS